MPYLSRCRTRHLKNPAIFKANSGKASAPETTGIQRDQIIPDLQPQCGPMPADNGGLPAGAVGRLDPGQIAGWHVPRRTLVNKIHSSVGRTQAHAGHRLDNYAKSRITFEA